MKLKINAAKSRVCPVEEVEFLGFQLRGKRLAATQAAGAEFRQRVKELTGRSWGVSRPYRIRELNRYLRGWGGSFSLGLKWRLVEEWDQWLRRRLRMGWWKRWRGVRCRVRELWKLGCDQQRAVHTARTRQSFWRRSRTSATPLGMTNEWLTQPGRVSLGDLWSAVHDPETNQQHRRKPEPANLWGW